MFRLEIFLGGTLYKEVDLTPQHEWLIGRSSTCDIVLDGSPEISRQHLKLQYQGGVWNLEILSRFGTLFQAGEKHTHLELRHGSKFDVPPFSFVFSDSEAVAQDIGFGSSHSIAQMGSISASAVSLPDTSNHSDVSDKTFVGNFNVVPYVRVCNENDEPVLAFRLEGNSWVAGRDAACTLCIDNVKFSRRHFEIRVEEGAYLIRDLGSSNGTLLNGTALISQEWVPFRSGDVLSVVDWKVLFELRDSSYEERLLGVSPDLRHPMIAQDGMMPSQAHETPQMGTASAAAAAPAKKKTNWVRLVIYLVVVGGLIGYFAPSQDETPTDVVDTKKVSTAFDKLTKQQQQYIRDTYRLAERLYKEGRYEMTRQEVAKIHQLVPKFEASDDLEKFATAGIQNQLDKQRAEAMENEQQEMEEKIRVTVAGCKRKVSSRIETRDIDHCLESVIALNPEHPDILSLKAQVEEIISKRIQDKERKAEYAALVRKQAGLYQKALALDKSGKPLDALVAYADVVKSKLPDPQDLKGRSQREIASIQNRLTSQQAELEKTSNELFKSGNLKAAISALKKAIDINPENEVLKGRMNSMLGDLKKQMQVLYQEGVLEESVGEVETAKTKWKKIIELSLPEEDYYKKARTKMKKYEAE
jgi:pSer/pThr/pTyr-binding forkhead associated (FHA) protein